VVRVLAGAGLSLCHRVQTNSAGPVSLLSKGLFPMSKSDERETDHSSPPNVEV